MNHYGNKLEEEGDIMKVLISHFTIESNEHVQGYTELNAFNLKFNDELIDAMYIGDTFKNAGIEIIPGIFANGHSGKVLSQEAFQYIHDKLVRSVKENLSGLDGIYLFLHGASNVEGLPEGSGEREILNSIRKITGPYLPIFVVMDPHGNLTEEYVDQLTFARCYRHSPHTDIVETHITVAEKMIEYLNNRRVMKPIYRKLPFVLGGERSVSTDEPMVSINKKLDDLEKDSRIFSASFHVGYLRHDSYAAGSGLVIVPNHEDDIPFVNQCIDELYDYCVDSYPRFSYHGHALELDDALEEGFLHDGLVVISDSGDNITSGAQGVNTQILRTVLNKKDFNNKRILFAGIKDEALFYKIKNYDDHEYFQITIGESQDELSLPVELVAKIIGRGDLQQIFGDTDSFGETITLSVKDYPVDILLIDIPVSFAEMHQYKAANINISDYNIIFVKQGYIFPELKEIASLGIMALTDGATNQQTERIIFKKIKRPMMPFDSMEDVKK